jgi:TldD protein
VSGGVRQILADLMDAAAGRADYADVRHVDSAAEAISTRNGRVDLVRRGSEQGIGVRVRIGGAWGFAAERGSDKAAAETALDRAIEVAQAQPRVPGAGPLAQEAPARGSYATALVTDPFEVPLEDKLALLLAADEGMRGDPRVTLTIAQFSAFRQDKLFASTDGALCDQRIVECGGGIVATATSETDAQVRSYPGAHREHVAQAGWEHFAGLDVVANAPRVAEEAVALLSAPQCPGGRTTLVLDGEQVALQVHESVGHALELDRVLGREASYAGTSWVSVPDLNSLRYGSEAMNITADATSPGGLGSFGWDDEGVAGYAFPLVSDGVLRGFLSSREAAAEIGLERSGGCMRADGFSRQPIIRMTNVNLAPGDAGSIDDLIADTDEGVYMETNRSWSIDNRRLHFQFATEVAWEIRDGQRTRLLRNPSYAGITPEFWGRLDAVCSEPEWRLWGLLNCGKGEPGQSMHVSHGAAPARFLDVQVGVA